jgi:hypothetical protein
MRKKDSQRKKRDERTAGTRERSREDIREFLHAEQGETSEMDRNLVVLEGFARRGEDLAYGGQDGSRQEGGLGEIEVSGVLTGYTEKETQGDEMIVDRDEEGYKNYGEDRESQVSEEGEETRDAMDTQGETRDETA